MTICMVPGWQILLQANHVKQTMSWRDACESVVHFFSHVGANCFGQLGLGHLEQVSTFSHVPEVRNAGALQAGEHCSSALTQDMTVYVWGRNDYGQLGLGGTTGHKWPEKVASHVAVHPSRTLRSGQGHGKRIPAPEAAEQQQQQQQQAGANAEEPVGPLPALFASYRRRMPRRSTGSLMYTPGRKDTTPGGRPQQLHPRDRTPLSHFKPVAKDKTPLAHTPSQRQQDKTPPAPGSVQQQVQ
jgi:hypothetical protein